MLHIETGDSLGDLVPRWAASATDPPNTFRVENFGEDANPVEGQPGGSLGMQRVALDVRTADIPFTPA